MQVPLVGPELEQRFSAQVMCTYVPIVVAFTEVSVRTDQIYSKRKFWFSWFMSCTISHPIYHRFLLAEATFSGNLRVELASSVNCDVQLERSYLVGITAC
jgi:hypothetical protein